MLMQMLCQFSELPKWVILRVFEKSVRAHDLGEKWGLPWVLGCPWQSQCSCLWMKTSSLLAWSICPDLSPWQCSQGLRVLRLFVDMLPTWTPCNLHEDHFLQKTNVCQYEWPCTKILPEASCTLDTSLKSLKVSRMSAKRVKPNYIAIIQTSFSLKSCIIKDQEWWGRLLMQWPIASRQIENHADSMLLELDTKFLYSYTEITS